MGKRGPETGPTPEESKDIKEETFVPEMNQIPSKYLELWGEHEQYPVKDSVWNEVIELAKEEKDTKIGKRGVYGNYPLQSFLDLTEKVRSEPNPIKRYRLLTEKDPDGKMWFDSLIGLRDETTIDALANEVNKKYWKNGLDLGTGDGILARKIQASCDQIIGIDRVPFFVRLAEERKIGKEQFVFVDVLDLPFPNNSFDLATSVGLAGSFDKNQLERYVSELSRVIIPGGSYFEAFSLKPDEGLDYHDRRSLANVKGILADMIVDKVSGKADLKDAWTLKDLVDIFKEKEFSYRKFNRIDERTKQETLIIEFVNHKKI